MPHTRRKSALLIIAFLGVRLFAQTPTTAPSLDLTGGWSTLHEGSAEATVEDRASHPTTQSSTLLQISCAKTAPPGDGRAGATNSNTIPVRAGEWFDINFSALTERGSVGLVVSLESSDGKVLARTTLPEIGRRARGPASQATTNSAWQHYRVALHVRDSADAAHLTITPIEPTNIWIDQVTLKLRDQK